MVETARKTLIIRKTPTPIGSYKEVSNKSTFKAVGLGPPKIGIGAAIHGWAALVLAVADHCGVSHVAVLRHGGRASRVLVESRRLLVWAFLEVSDMDEAVSISWLEQCMALGRRTLTDALRAQAPDGLQDVIATYHRLFKIMGPADVKEVVSAGLLGERRPRARMWSKGFLKRLGLG
jgi:hypothetical protein